MSKAATVETHHIKGLDLHLPIIKRLSGGYVLCDHPNGPAICDEFSISTADGFIHEQARTKTKKELVEFGFELVGEAFRALHEWAKERRA